MLNFLMLSLIVSLLLSLIEQEGRKKKETTAKISSSGDTRTSHSFHPSIHPSIQSSYHGFGVYIKTTAFFVSLPATKKTHKAIEKEKRETQVDTKMKKRQYHVNLFLKEKKGIMIFIFFPAELRPGLHQERQAIVCCEKRVCVTS